MDYAVDYGIRKETRVLPFEDGKEGKEFVLENEDAKIRFLRGLTITDTLWVEMGSGADYFCLGAAAHGAAVFRLPTHLAKEARGENAKSFTAQALARMAREEPDSFWPLRQEETPVLRLRVNTREYLHYQREVRGSVERRVEAAAREVFLLEQPEMTFEAFRKQRLANDPSYQGCLVREKQLHAEIEKAVKELPVYEQVFRRIRGCGPVTAGLIIGEIGDIRRFPKDHPERLRAYAGYAVYEGVSSVRLRRAGTRITYQPNLQVAVWYFSQFGVVIRKSGFSGWRDLYEARKAYLAGKYTEKTWEVEETETDERGRVIAKRRRIIPFSEWEAMPGPYEEKRDGHTFKRERRGLPLYSPRHIDQMTMRYVGEKFLNAVHWWWHTFLEGGEIPEEIEPSGRAPWLSPVT